jgi:hypothetical protein
MPLTKKEHAQFIEIHAILREAWKKACREEGVPEDTAAVIFSSSNASAKEYNQHVDELIKIRNRIRHNVARRERHAALTGMGLKRVKGDLGVTYYE